jgi:hypothetical protein
MSLDVTVDIDLTDVKKLLLLPTQVNITVQQAINDVMSQVFQESQRLVPVDTGMLRASGKFTHPQLGANQPPQAEIEYGGGAVDYALIVHEDLNARHKSPTQAKYLEIPFSRSIGVLQNHIQNKLNELMSRQ